ncbi:MAG: nicotinamide mononucleotide transporter [Clostridiaceae bacterium]|jgi:nicotinamide mononucleotide transporter|nr:nicotinamide mononucleotide transporter [Clostridiaceae bacterium]
MLMKTRRFLRSFTPYQIGYLTTVLLITAAFAVFFPDLMLEETSSKFVTACSVVAVLANPVCELLISKQSKLNFLVDALLIEIPEFILCIAMGWYTVAITTMVFWIPIDIFSYLQWSRHPDRQEEELTEVRRLSWKQAVLAVAGIILFSVVVGYLISRLPGATDSYIDALASACGMANGILLLLRHSEQWYAWLMTLILYAIMYVSSGAYIMLVTVTAMFVNTCYGYYKWYQYTQAKSRIR